VGIEYRAYNIFPPWSEFKVVRLEFSRWQSEHLGHFCKTLLVFSESTEMTELLRLSRLHSHCHWRVQYFHSKHVKLNTTITSECFRLWTNISLIFILFYFDTDMRMLTCLSAMIDQIWKIQSAVFKLVTHCVILLLLTMTNITSQCFRLVNRILVNCPLM